MLAELNHITSIGANICIISFSILLVVKYCKLKKYFYYYMDIDNLLNQVDSTDNCIAPTQENQSNDKIKERLTLVVVSGKSKDFLGKLYSIEDIEKLDEKELTKLYARYEASLGGHTTKLLKKHMISAYTNAAELAFPVISQGRLAVSDKDELCKSLNDGPFIDLALTTLTSKLYHDYGQFLAPLEGFLITSNYVQSVQEQPQQTEEQQPQTKEEKPKQEKKQPQPKIDDLWSDVED